MANKAFMDQLKVAVEVMEIFLVSCVGSIVQRNSFEIRQMQAFLVDMPHSLLAIADSLQERFR